MVKSSDEVRSDIERINAFDVSGICEQLRQHEVPLINYLADFVASICDVPVDSMFQNVDRVSVAQARWLFWYAYRYMTGDTYEKISIVTSRLGHKFTSQGVTHGVNKMAVIIEKEPIWRKRWTIIKHIIKEYNADLLKEDGKPKIVVRVPKELMGCVSVEYVND